jgi:hypothetical protein
MKKILEKWYVSLVILPLLINIISSLINPSAILSNWQITLTITLFIIILILTYELVKLKKENIQLNSIPNAGDVKIIKKLLNTLNVTMFEQEIKKQYCWYGYPKEAFRNVSAFIDQSSLLENKTSNKQLSSMITNVRKDLIKFRHEATKVLFSNGDFYEIDKHNPHNRKKSEEICPIVDDLSDDAFETIGKLLDFLKSKNYL